MSLHELAGKPAPRSILANIPRLVAEYYTNKPDVSEAAQLVAFGTSGHRGSSLNNSFNEAHILAISQAICEYRKGEGIEGPLYLGMDSHALSEPAFAGAIEVFAANGVDVFIQAGLGYTPTPVVSHAIIIHNRKVTDERKKADGVVITPSHNPPEDGGIKYNPPHGGPADTATTTIIEKRANEILAQGLADVRRMPYQRAMKADSIHRHDYITPYVNDLGTVIDMESIAAAGIRIGIDQIGRAHV